MAAPTSDPPATDVPPPDPDHHQPGEPAEPPGLVYRSKGNGPPEEIPRGPQGDHPEPPAFVADKPGKPHG